MTLISKEARAYKKLIAQLALTWRRKPIKERISISIQAYPPDKRVRDLDNLLKILIDSLKDANLFLDDSQIDKIYIERMSIFKKGKLDIKVEEINV